MADELLLALTAVAALGGVGIVGGALFRRYYRARFDFTFADKSDKLHLNMGEDRKICIEITNQSRGQGRKIEAGFVYVPSSFTLTKAEAEGSPVAIIQLFPEATTGRFANYRYVSLPQFYFSRRESSPMCVNVKTPSSGGLFKVFIVLHLEDTSVEGSLTLAVS
ncbi:MAG: hypothetical protein HY247_00655 [archaeon]|nr:MAG: hypothetical protein HY247_00655 [archaeon]